MSESPEAAKLEPMYAGQKDEEKPQKTHMEKCEVFNKWCDEVGVKSEKVQYPAYFDGGLVGVQAKKDIRHREMIMSVPYSILMTIDKAKRHPVIGRIFSDNPQLFGE